MTIKYSLHICIEHPTEDDIKAAACVAEAYTDQWLYVRDSIASVCDFTDDWLGENCEHGFCARVDVDDDYQPSVLQNELEHVPGVYSVTFDMDAGISELFFFVLRSKDSLPTASEEERQALAEILDNEGFGGAEDDIKDHEDAVLLAQAKLDWYRNVRNVRH